jgi:GTP-binding protein HflX
LLQIIDISDEDNKQKIEVVENILKELGIADKRRIFVFNKIDASNGINKIELIEKYAKYNPQFISVRDNLGIDSLLSSF